MKYEILPGKKTSATIFLIYTGLILLLPIFALVFKAGSLGLSGIWEQFTRPAVQSAAWLTVKLSFLAALFNLIFGLVSAWVLSRYDFPLKKLADSLLDLPFALPGAVGGIALASTFGAKGILGKFFALFGVEISYTPSGIFIALVFVGLPFVVRVLQPVIEGLDVQEEEAALLLGASPINTFKRVILPALFPALISGFVMAFARGLGEYGTVIFIAGNLPFKSEVLTQVIYNKIDTYDVKGATSLALGILLISFLSLLVFNFFQHRISNIRSKK